MQLEKCLSGLASTRGDFPCTGALVDAEQETDHDIAPEQSAELFGEFRGAPLDESDKA